MRQASWKSIACGEDFVVKLGDELIAKYGAGYNTWTRELNVEISCF